MAANKKVEGPIKGLLINNVDPGEITGGVWVDYNNIRLKIARKNNDVYLKRYMDGIKQGKKTTEAVVYAIAGGVLTDWAGFKVAIDDEIVDVPFDEANAFEVLQNDEMALEFITDFCNNDANFIKAGYLKLKKK